MGKVMMETNSWIMNPENLSGAGKVKPLVRSLKSTIRL